MPESGPGSNKENPVTDNSIQKNARRGLVLIGCLALVQAMIHVLTNGNYGYFRDEYYYIACSDRLAWGYVDQPPLSIFLLRIIREILGSSVFAIRLVAVAAEAGVVVLTGLLARAIGGGFFAQGLAALTALLTPVFLGVGSFYSMNALEHFFWALALYILVWIIKTDNSRLWLLFGLVAGLGLQNKISMIVLGFGVAVGLVLTPHRNYIKNKFLWLGGAIAFAIFVPYIVWQVLNGAPTLEFIHNASTLKNVDRSPFQFLVDVAFMANPLHALIMLIGLAFLFFSRGAGVYRILAWTTSAVFVLFMIQSGAKSYYVGPIFPALLAAGAVAIERLASKPKMMWLKPVIVLVILAGGALSVPLATPVIPIENYTAYEEWLGIRAPQEEKGHTGRIPQLFSDRFGWREMTETVTKVYRDLPDEEQAKCIIFTGNYGEAGALEFHGKAYGLPRVTSAHNNYYLWGYGDFTGEVLITVGISKEDMESVFGRVELVARHHHTYAMPEENDVPILVCREPKGPVDEIWPKKGVFI